MYGERTSTSADTWHCDVLALGSICPHEFRFVLVGSSLSSLSPNSIHVFFLFARHDDLSISGSLLDAEITPTSRDVFTSILGGA